MKIFLTKLHQLKNSLLGAEIVVDETVGDDVVDGTPTVVASVVVSVEVDAVVVSAEKIN